MDILTPQPGAEAAARWLHTIVKTHSLAAAGERASSINSAITAGRRAIQVAQAPVGTHPTSFGFRVEGGRNVDPSQTCFEPGEGHSRVIGDQY